VAKLKVLIADKLASVAKNQLEELGIQAHDKSGIDYADLKDVIQDFDGLIVRSRTKPAADLMQVADKLKVIGRAGVGVDNIDLEAAQAKNIVVVNTPTSTALAVAEHTLALMLAAVKHIPVATTRMKEGQWPKNELQAFELSGKTLGIVGLGNIGALVAARASAFDMQIIAYDPFLDDAIVKQRGALPQTLDELFTAADLISFHLPLTDETRALVNQEAFNKMKPGVVIIQTARGGVIDEEALLAALNSGRVRSAGLDVFATEPPQDSALVQHPNVVTTPHIAAQTAEAQIRAATDVAQEVANVLLGQEIRWRVN
jgi:D-3-phosphoglycerate dehydrogenase